jgi:hypothetical protein
MGREQKFFILISSFYSAHEKKAKEGGERGKKKVKKRKKPWRAMEVELFLLLTPGRYQSTDSKSMTNFDSLTSLTIFGATTV